MKFTSHQACVLHTPPHVGGILGSADADAEQVDIVGVEMCLGYDSNDELRGKIDCMGDLYLWLESASRNYSINSCGGLGWRKVKCMVPVRAGVAVALLLLPLLLVVLLRGVWVASHRGSQKLLGS